MSDPLYACPFCGSDNLDEWTDDGLFAVSCFDCDAAGPTAPSRDDARWAWNGRVTP
jgi:Lar family restriction alleviation protein